MKRSTRPFRVEGLYFATYTNARAYAARLAVERAAPVSVYERRSQNYVEIDIVTPLFKQKTPPDGERQVSEIRY